MVKIKCKCGNPYFAKVSINQFRDMPTNLHASLHEVEPDYDIRIYQCICCKNYMMPPVNYFNSTENDKELYSIIESALKGEVVKPRGKFKGKRIQRGTAAFVNGENDTSNAGKIVPME